MAGAVAAERCRVRGSFPFFLQKWKESRPLFMGAVKRLHHSFEDPPPASQGTDEERVAIFRRVRDELRAYLGEFALTLS
jgi:hypothetical protein